MAVKTKPSMKVKRNILTGRTKTISRTKNPASGVTTKKVTVRRKSGVAKKVKTTLPPGESGYVKKAGKTTVRTKKYRRDGSIKKTKTLVKGKTRGESGKVVRKYKKDRSVTPKTKIVSRGGRLSDGTKTKKDVMKFSGYKGKEVSETKQKALRKNEKSKKRIGKKVAKIKKKISKINKKEFKKGTRVLKRMGNY